MSTEKESEKGTITTIQWRGWEVYNNDPQRRCYNGAHYSTAERLTAWETIDWNVKNPEDRMEFWRDLNDYAVSQRGKSARCEFRVVKVAVPS